MTASAPQAPLSFAQERLWFVHQLDPAAHTHVVTSTTRVRGPLSVEALQTALSGLASRHDQLRARFDELEDGTPVQRIEADVTPRLALHDLRSAEPDVRAEAAEQLLHAENRTVFDLRLGPPVRALLVRVGAAEHLLAVSAHHIVCDGRSIAIVHRDLAELYAAALDGRPPDLPPLQATYLGLAEKDRARLASQEDRLLAYWREKLGDLASSVSPRSPSGELTAGQVSRTLPLGLSRQVSSVARSLRVSPFMLLLSGLLRALAREGFGEQVPIATAIANRSHPGSEDVVGMFVNVLVLRTDIARAASFAEIVGRVRETALGAYKHQELPFEALVRGLHIDRDPARLPLADISFALQNVHGPGLRLRGLECDRVELPRDVTEWRDEINAFREVTGYVVEYSFRTVDRSPAAAEQVLASFAEVLREGLDAPHAALPSRSRHSSFAGPVLARAGREPDPSVVAEIERHARSVPDALAVRSGADTLSYAQLTRAAGALARRLAERGLPEDGRVAVLARPSVRFVAAMLGVMRAGGAVLALDVRHPAARHAAVLEDSGAFLVIADDAGKALLRGTAPPVLEIGEGLAGEPIEGRRRPRQPDNLAYAVYTSGSTGRPKGVAITHAGLGNLAAWHREDFGVNAASRCAPAASPGFDAWHWEIWPYLAAGASVILPPDDARGDGPALVNWMAKNAITHAFLTSPLFEAALAEAPPDDLGLKVMLTGADRLERVPDAGQRFAVVNCYGPTEASVISTAARVTPGAIRPPIGRPIRGVDAHVLDADLRPVADGQIGELHIAGVSLARGYLNDPRRTADRFVPSPFDYGSRMYRTGDKVRKRPCGVLEYLDRTDRQLKIRGVRVEPAEVEAVLLQHPAVREAVVVPDGGDGTTRRRLLAYWVAAGSASDRELRSFLSSRVPTAMVPSAFVAMDRLPLTVNGKVDRTALPSPVLPASSTSDDALSPLEAHVAAIWSEVIGVSDIGPEDNFFELGGHSLQAGRVLARLASSTGVRLPLRTVFEAASVRDLSLRVLEASSLEDQDSTVDRDGDR
ncbi:MAG TPA: amino acid adenylation domain-containing protein [Solirubrobacteraceae bacterium]|jgi:amino acid adenylation domain-containing protein